MPPPRPATRRPAWPIATLHLLALPALVLSLATGLRLAVTDGYLPAWLGPLLPVGRVLPWHLGLAWWWLAIALIYALWRWRRRGRSVQPGSDASPPRVLRWHRHLTTIGWSLVLLLMVTGLLQFLLPRSLAGDTLAWTHLLGGIAFLLYLPLHLAVSWPLAGWRGWLRALWPSDMRHGHRWMLLAIIGIALTATGLAMSPARWWSPKLMLVRIDPADNPEIDGSLVDPLWSRIEPVEVITVRAVNTDDGMIPVRIRAAHNGVTAYFALSWPDPTRSGVMLPLLKTADGWRVLHDGFERHDETRYYEDKLAILLSRSDEPGGGGSFHAGSRPLRGAPASASGRGYHYTAPGGLVDVWHWKALRNDEGILDDSHFGPPAHAWCCERRHTAGYSPDPADAGDVNENWQWFDPERVVPKRLPRDPRRLEPFQRLPDPDEPGDHGMWMLSWYETRPYTPELDTYPVGTLMPSVLWKDAYEGDRRDVRAVARWHEGEWTLELARALQTGSEYDLPIRDGIALWVSVFDHTQARHSYHIRPLILELE
jgi:hypothetical protein